MWNYANQDDHWYVVLPSGILTETTILMCTYFILFNTFIPISLIINLEFVKLA